MKVVNKEGEAELLESAMSVAGERLPWIGTDAAEQMVQRAIRETVKNGLEEAAKTFAEEIVAWVMETDVWFSGNCPGERDITLEIVSDLDVLYTVTVLDLLVREIDVMDADDVKDDDATEHRGGLSSREYTRQKIVRALRAMADRVEQHITDDR